MLGCGIASACNTTVGLCHAYKGIRSRVIPGYTASAGVMSCAEKQNRNPASTLTFWLLNHGQSIIGDLFSIAHGIIYTGSTMRASEFGHWLRKVHHCAQACTCGTPPLCKLVDRHLECVACGLQPAAGSGYLVRVWEGKQRLPTLAQSTLGDDPTLRYPTYLPKATLP